MDFWQRMRTTLDKGLESSRDLFAKAKDQAQELGQKGVLKFEIMQLEDQAQKLLAKLGEVTYRAFAEQGQKSVTRNTQGVESLMSQIQDVRSKIQEKEKQLSREEAHAESGDDDGSEGKGEGS